MYQLTINNQEYEIDSSEELKTYLLKVDKSQFSEIWLSNYVDEINDFKKSSICVLRNENLAFVTFLEDENNYFHSVNDLQKKTDEVIEFELSNGQHDFYPKSYFIEIEKAIRAVLFFYKFNEKADFIKWENN